MDIEPRHYECCRTVGPVVVDGRLVEPTWKRAAWTELFVDIEGESRPSPAHSTRAMMAWDDEFFYVAAEGRRRLAHQLLAGAACARLGLDRM